MSDKKILNGTLELNNSDLIIVNDLSTGGSGVARLKFKEEAAVDSMQIYYDGDGQSGDANYTSIYSHKSGVGDVLVTTYGGNVGIGTASPGAKLEVNGNIAINAGQKIQLSGSADSTHHIYHDATTDYDKINYSSGFQLEHHTSGIQMTLVGSGGNVGIGTTSPAGKLEVRQAANNGNTGAFTNTHVKLTASATADNTGFVGITAATSTADNYGYSFGAQRTSGGVGDFKINYHNNSAAGTNRFIIDQNGNVGIGTPLPSEKLHVYNGSAYITPIAYAANQNDWVIRTGAYNNTSFDQGLKIKSTSGGVSYMAFETAHSGGETMVLRSGNVGIGTDSPAGKFDVRTDSSFGNCRIVIPETTNQNPVLAFYRPTGSAALSYPWWFEANGSNFHIKTGSAANIGSETVSTKVTINSSGNVGIGQTNPSTYKLDVSGTIRATGDVIAYSDIRVKENIKTIDNALNKVKKLRGVEYNKIDSSEKSIGVIAQEIEDVIPQVVREDDKGMKSVAYGNITAVLIEAIKEQQKQIDELKNQLDAFAK